jgi:hypothetical protein
MTRITQILKSIGQWWLDRHPRHLDDTFNRWA